MRALQQLAAAGCQWKLGRAVEGTGLENRQGFAPFVSSNLTASAKCSYFLYIFVNKKYVLSRTFRIDYYNFVM